MSVDSLIRKLLRFVALVSLGIVINVCSSNLSIVNALGESTTAKSPVFMYVMKETPLFNNEDAIRWQKYDITLAPNTKVEIIENGSDSDFNYSAYYNCKIVDKDGVVYQGYVLSRHLSPKPTTTLDDFNKYLPVLKKSYKYIKFEDYIKSPVKQAFSTLTFTLVDDDIVNWSEMKNGGMSVDIASDEYGRFIIEIPFKQIYLDGQEGWDETDRFFVWVQFSKIGEYTNSYGMVFRIPVFTAIGVYDGYRFMHL